MAWDRRAGPFTLALSRHPSSKTLEAAPSRGYHEPVNISEFDANRYLSLATFRKSGAEVKTPVWFAAESGKLYLFSAANAGKLKRLRNFSRARVAPCDVRGKITGEWRDTNARIVGDAALIDRVYRAFSQKYGWQIALFNLGARLVGKFHKRVFVEVDF